MLLVKKKYIYLLKCWKEIVLYIFIISLFVSVEYIPVYFSMFCFVALTSVSNISECIRVNALHGVMLHYI